MFISDSLKYYPRNDLMTACIDYEAVFIEIEREHASNLIVGNVYRAPNTSVNNLNSAFDSCLNAISTENKLCYIVGDFNLNLIDCSTHQPTEDFVNTIYAHGLRPLIDKPTRIGCHSATLIDNIFTNNDSDVIPGILYADLSDHLPLFQITPFCLQRQEQPKKIYIKRNINNSTIQAFTSHLECTDWNEVYESADVDLAYNCFHSKFLNLYNFYFSFVSKTISKAKRNQPWISQALINSCRHKNNLYKRFLHNPTKANEQRYKQFRNRLTTIIRSAKRNHYASKLNSNKNNVKNTWREINNILGKNKKAELPDKIDDGQQVASNPSDISQSFNNYFTSIGSLLASKIPHTNTHFTYLHDSNPSSFFLIPTNFFEINEMGKLLKSVSSCGFDGISSYVVKTVIPFISQPLAYIFNLSFVTGFLQVDVLKPLKTPVT